VADGTQKTLVFIVGPPAVGKMTVGLALSEITGLPLFHGHLSIEAVLPIFDFGSEPFSRLVGDFRRAVFTEVAESDLPGLIFTYVWAFDHPGEQRFVERLTAIFEERGGRAVFVELQADLETRLERNETPERLAAKQSKRDLTASRERLLANDRDYRINSNGDFPLPDHLLIDNTEVSPQEVAKRIVERFGLRRVIPRAVP
jgi:shikimate kinase